MAKGQENGATILLGLKDDKVGEVGDKEKVVVKTSAKGKERRCPYCGSGKLFGHGRCKPRKVLHTWSNGRGVYLELYRRWKCRHCKHTFTEGADFGNSAPPCKAANKRVIFFVYQARGFFHFFSRQSRLSMGGVLWLPVALLAPWAVA